MLHTQHSFRISVFILWKCQLAQKIDSWNVHISYLQSKCSSSYPLHPSHLPIRIYAMFAKYVLTIMSDEFQLGFWFAEYDMYLSPRYQWFVFSGLYYCENMNVQSYINTWSSEMPHILLLMHSAMTSQWHQESQETHNLWHWWITLIPLSIYHHMSPRKLAWQLTACFIEYYPALCN